MNNLRGIVLMVAAMAGFAIEDAFIKQLARTMPVGEILLLLSAGGTLIYLAWARLRGVRFSMSDAIALALLARTVFEMIGTLGFVTALAVVPLSVATTILQAAPLFVTMGAALFLGEAVGWRRWLAIGTGFLGVLLVVRPDAGGFDVNMLWAVVGVVFLSARDVATRRVPPGIPTLLVSAMAFAGVGLVGAAMIALDGRYVIPGAREWTMVAGALSVGVAAYWAITESHRSGDLSVIAPFRYSRLVFALAVGWTVFGEWPQSATFAGAALIIGSGLYAFWRERVRARQKAMS